MDRRRLLGISGRSFKAQKMLAAEKGIFDYPCPAGGCLLTDKNFASRMRDYFVHSGHPYIKDVALLRVGKHFRFETGDKVILARNEIEGKRLAGLCREPDHLPIPIDFPGPTVILFTLSI